MIANCCFWLLLEMIWVQGKAARVSHLLGGVGLFSYRTSKLLLCILDCADSDSVNAHSKGSGYCLTDCLTLLAAADG